MTSFHGRKSRRRSIRPAWLAVILLIFSSQPAISAQAGDAGTSLQESDTNLQAGKPARSFTARNRNKSAAAVRDWSRAPLRPEPHSTDPSTGLTEVPKIRFASASGAEEHEESATNPLVAPSKVDAEAESETPPATTSLSVKEQLLNALRAQREATTGEKSSQTTQGSLTILHSPSEVSSPAKSPSATPLKEHADVASGVPKPEVTSPRLGLTRTLENDLKSTDPYIRERAQRYLKLEMQLLQLRASKAAEAEHRTPGTNPQTPQPVALHDTEPADATSHAPDHHPQLNVHEHNEEPHAGHQPDDGTPEDPHAAEENSAVDIQGGDSAPSPNASLMENIVVDGPIDRLGLANNLFAVGEYPLALEMYQQTFDDTLSAQQHFWVEYQTANCLRRLGKSAEASNRYRKLASQPEAGWLSRQAHWWVTTLEKIRLLEATLADNSIEHHRAVVEDVERERQKSSGVTPTAGDATGTPAANSGVLPQTGNSPTTSEAGQSHVKDPVPDAHAH